MKKIFSLSLLTALALLTALPTDACTSAIFTGKSTPDGRSCGNTAIRGNSTIVLNSSRPAMAANTVSWVW